MFHNRNWLSVISNEESVIRWNFSLNCYRLSLPNSIRTRESINSFFNARVYVVEWIIIARLTRIDRLVFSDGTIGLFTFELLWHLNGSIAMTSPPSFYYRYSFRYRRDLLKNQTIYHAVYNGPWILISTSRKIFYSANPRWIIKFRKTSTSGRKYVCISNTLDLEGNKGREVRISVSGIVRYSRHAGTKERREREMVNFNLEDPESLCKSSSYKPVAKVNGMDSCVIVTRVRSPPMRNLFSIKLPANRRNDNCSIEIDF